MPVTDRQEDFVAPPLSDPYWATAHAPAGPHTAAPAPAAITTDAELQDLLARCPPAARASVEGTSAFWVDIAHEMKTFVQRYVEQQLAALKRELGETRRELHEVKAKSLQDHGTWLPQRRYPAGAATTHDGALWIARQDTEERPGDGATAWRLAVKRGRDGRDRRSDREGTP